MTDMTPLARQPWVLALDVGTQSVRALLFDGQGEIVAKCQEALTEYTSKEPGWMEHDAQALWSACCRAIKGLWQVPEVSPNRVAGVVVTTQRGSLAPVDRHGRALRPFIIWLDQRRASVARKVSPWWRLAFQALGISRTIDHFSKEAEVNWLEEHEPAHVREAYKFLLVSGFVNHRLTGLMADSVASQVAYLPFDFKRQRWARRSDWKWQALAVRPDQLPDLVPVGEILGHVTAEAAGQTGLPCGLPVIAGAADKACEILGSGAMDPSVAAVSYGTTATINITSPRYLEATRFVPPYPAVLAGCWHPEVQIFRGYWMVSWFKAQFGHPERAQACAQGVTPEALFDELVRTVPPGSQGLMLQPYWTPGVRQPGPEARGAIIGFTDAHTRAHVYRAILEGIAYALREGMERIQSRSRQPITSLRVSGGGSQSDMAMQITADVFGLPASRPHTYETSGLGAAMIGAVALGIHPDYPTALAAMCRVSQTFWPDPTHHRTYDTLYRKVYLAMYAQLGPLYRQLWRLKSLG